MTFRAGCIIINKGKMFPNTKGMVFFMKTKKKNYLRFVLVLSALAIILTVLAACKRDAGGDDGTSDPDATTVAPEVKVPVSEAVNYKFVRPEKIGSDFSRAFSSLHSRFDAALGASTEQSDDFYREGVPQFEIKELEVLVGTTNRPESVEFVSSLRTKDYGYALIGKKIVIAGRTEEGTVKAMEEFEKNIIARYEADKTATDIMSSSDNYIYNAAYDVDTLSIGDVDIREWKIVYPYKRPMGEDIAAARLADAIASVCGYTVDVIRDNDIEGDAGHVISVGATAFAGDALSAELKKAEGSAFIGCDGKAVIVGGGDSTATLAAVEKFAAELTAAISRDGKNATLRLDAGKKYDIGESILTAMSFNVLVSSKSDVRTQRVIDMVLKYLPDTIGFQEASPDWMTSLTTGSLRSIYAYVGEGRNGGNSGEYNPVFYNKTKFTLRESGTHWMSDTPDVASKFQESTYNRIYTYALLERKSDGKLIMIVNTHLDHKSEPARVKQIKVLLEFIEKYRDYPIVLSGDFNTTPTSNVYSTVVKSFMKDSADVAMQAKRASTFTNYGKSDKTLDYLFVNPAGISVSSYSVCNEKINGDYPSDHHPVLIKYTING